MTFAGNRRIQAVKRKTENGMGSTYYTKALYTVEGRKIN